MGRRRGPSHLPPGRRCHQPSAQHRHARHHAPESVHGGGARVVLSRRRRGRLVVLRGSTAVLRGGPVLWGGRPAGVLVVGRRRGGGRRLLLSVLAVDDNLVFGAGLVFGEPFEGFRQLVSGGRGEGRGGGGRWVRVFYVFFSACVESLCRPAVRGWVRTAAALSFKAAQHIGTRRHPPARGCRACKFVMQRESDRSPSSAPPLGSPSTLTHPSCMGSEAHTQVSTARRNLPLVSLFSADIRLSP